MSDDETLWAVHMEGPDDVLAMSDKTSAETYAERINAWFSQRRRQNGTDPVLDPQVVARVIPWPYSAESHADELRRRA